MTAPLQKSPKMKQPIPNCHLYDHMISRECNDKHLHSIPSLCGAWHAKLPFVRDPGCILSINNWFAHGMKRQDIGSANSGIRIEDDHPP